MHDPPVVHPGGSPARVMVVDDEADLAEVLSSVLRLAGYEVRTAGTGGGAVQLAEEFSSDAVILDVMLPDLDGWQVLERLRRADPSVCVLFLIARNSVEDRVAGIRHGGDDYLTKPFHLEEVVVRLRRLLRRAGGFSLIGKRGVTPLTQAATMNLIETRTTYGDTPAPRRVCVPGRDDTGIVVTAGMNFGLVFCFGIRFPITGERLYFEASRLTDINNGTTGL